VSLGRLQKLERIEEAKQVLQLKERWRGGQVLKTAWRIYSSYTTFCGREEKLTVAKSKANLPSLNIKMK
jgi:hypothetical protein